MKSTPPNDNWGILWMALPLVVVWIVLFIDFYCRRPS